jgi:acetyl esterase
MRAYRTVLLLAALQLAGAAAGAEPTAAPAPSSHIYAQRGGTGLPVFVFEPPADATGALRPVMLTVHGGGWRHGEAAWTFRSAERFAGLGFVAVAVEYRLADDSVTPIDQLDDVCDALKWLRSQAAALKIDPNRIAAYGVSAGGHLAAMAATRGCPSKDGSFGNGGPDALLLWSPALDVSHDGWFASLLAKRASAAEHSPADQVRTKVAPTTIVHGAADTLTPLAGAERFCDLARRHGSTCELQAYPNLGHLLTRNLKHQESDFDPDPAAQADGIRRHEAFITTLWPR